MSLAALGCSGSNEQEDEYRYGAQAASLSDVPLEGEFFAPSLELTFGVLSLSSADGGHSVYGEWTRGEWSGVRAEKDGAIVAQIELERPD